MFYIISADIGYCVLEDAQVYGVCFRTFTNRYNLVEFTENKGNANDSQIS